MSYIPTFVNFTEVDLFRALLNKNPTAKGVGALGYSILATKPIVQTNCMFGL